MRAAMQGSGLPTTKQTLNGASDSISSLKERHRPGNADDYVLVIGGAGFVGSNLAHRLMSEGKRVLVFDSLARTGVEQNLQWLRQHHGARLLVQIADMRNTTALDAAVRHAQAVFHLAAQVAVTTSLNDPLHDFAVNAEGTLTLLELLRKQALPYSNGVTPVSSTRKGKRNGTHAVKEAGAALAMTQTPTSEEMIYAEPH